MPCLTHWHIWLCHMDVGRTLVLSPSTYKYVVDALSTHWHIRLYVPYGG
jgi:hypothetical protein